MNLYKYALKLIIAGFICLPNTTMPMWPNWDNKTTIITGGASIGFLGIFTGWYAAKCYYSNAMIKTKKGSGKNNLISDMSEQHEETIKNLQGEIGIINAKLTEAQQQTRDIADRLEDRNRQLILEKNKNQEINKFFNEKLEKAQKDSLAVRFVNRYQRDNPDAPLSWLDIAKTIVSAATQNISMRAIPAHESHECKDKTLMTGIAYLRAGNAESMAMSEVIEE